MGCRRNCGKNSSLRQSNVEILYVVLAVVSWNLLQCIAEKIFLRHLLLVVFKTRNWGGCVVDLFWYGHFCALGSNAGISLSACGAGIQKLYISTSGEASLAPWASSAPTAGRHFAICVSWGTIASYLGDLLDLQEPTAELAEAHLSSSHCLLVSRLLPAYLFFIILAIHGIINQAYISRIFSLCLILNSSYLK